MEAPRKKERKSEEFGMFNGFDFYHFLPSFFFSLRHWWARWLRTSRHESNFKENIRNLITLVDHVILFFYFEREITKNWAG